jgi:pimeloyl-ACP methyl ester carboxylesterase
MSTCVVRGAPTKVLDSGGARDAPVLLALHGYPDTGRIFTRLAAALGTVRVIAPDWPGQGESEPIDACFGPTERAAWIVDLLDALGVERCSVFGHDMGALPALALARDHAPRVRAVVVANALLSNEAKTSLAIRVLRTSGAYRVAIPHLGPVVFARCLASFLEHPLDPVLASDLRRSFLRPSALATITRACSAYDRELPGFLRTLGTIATPVHALWGSHAPHFAFDHASALQRAVPRATLAQLPGSHWMVHERAGTIAYHVRSACFL